jgi:HK97 family phage prohead protease
MRYKFLSAGVDSTLNPRQVRVIASSGVLDREGDIVVPAGCDLSDYRLNPIVLADHDPRQPIGNAVVTLASDRLEATITFAPEGISEKADTYCGLMKSGILRSVSIGFMPIDAKPMTEGRGRVYTKWKLLELSVVSVPANPDAIVIGRSRKGGRVLSSINAERLRAAHDMAEQCRSAVRQVLDEAGVDDLDNDQKSAARRRRSRMVKVLALAEPRSTLQEREAARRVRMVRVLRLGSGK